MGDAFPGFAFKAPSVWAHGRSCSALKKMHLRNNMELNNKIKLIMECNFFIALALGCFKGADSERGPCQLKKIEKDINP